MKTTVRADVELWDIDVFAELAIWERRPELQRLCNAALEQGTLGLAEVDAALPGLSETGRKNVLRQITRLGLVDELGALTRFGRRCATKGEAPAWELGTCSFLVAVHPMFESFVLDFKRVPGDSQDRDFASLGDLPTWFAPTPRRISKSAFDAAVTFTLHALPTPGGADPPCRAHQRGTARLAWDIDLDTGRNTWRIEGKIDGQHGSTPFSAQGPAIAEDRLTGAFAGWERRYKRATGRVEGPYDGGAINGHDRFLRELPYPQVSLSELGTFADVLVEDVPVGPSNPKEAHSWALALMIARISAADSYCTNEARIREWASVVRGTPLEPHLRGVVAPSSDEAVTGKRVSARVRWLVQAATDLAME
jgi:hypothetical protein